MKMVRLATLDDKEAVNELRRQVNELHVNGRPDLFKPGFCRELKDHVDQYLNREIGYAAVDERGGRVVGMVLVDYIERPESPYAFARRYCHVGEICVDEGYRRQGAGSELLKFVKDDAKEKGFPRVELDVWSFNDALSFYEAEGYTVFRRYLELRLD